MTLDLTKAKPGWIAHFRNGGKSEILSAEPSEKFSKATWFQLTKLRYGCSYRLDGRLNSNNGDFLETPFDIIRLEEPAFDGATVKPGDAFKFNETIIYYIGPDISNEKYAVFSGEIEVTQTSLDVELKRAVKRAPEHDIEVPS